MIQSWLTDRRTGAPVTTARVNIWHEHHEDGHPHTHMLVELDTAALPRRRVDRRLTVELDFNGIHPNVTPLNTNTHFRNAVAYRNKEPDYLILPDGTQVVTAPLIQVAPSKPRNFNVLLHEEVYRRLEADQELESLKSSPDWGPNFLSRPQLWDYILTLREQFLRERDLQQVQPLEPDAPYWREFLRPYFEDFLVATEENDLTWNNRRVFWVYDSRGCGEKTKLSTYLWRKFYPDVRELTGQGNDKDLLFTCQLTDRVFVFDFARAVKSSAIPYSVIEACCDGRFFRAKYQSQMVRSVRSQRIVIVLCNHEPDWDQLSRDRFYLFNCETGETFLPGDSALRSVEE